MDNLSHDAYAEYCRATGRPTVHPYGTDNVWVFPDGHVERFPAFTEGQTVICGNVFLDAGAVMPDWEMIAMLEGMS